MNLLELSVLPTDPRQFQISVSQSVPAVGEGTTQSSLPFWSDERDWRTTIIKVLESESFSPEAFSEDEQAWLVQTGILLSERTSFSSTYLAKIGQLLYQSLFPPDSQVKQALRTALYAVCATDQATSEESNSELHLRLKFPADSPLISRLADYPWELLHDGERFLLRSVQLSRYIAYPSVPPNLPRQEKLQVLLVSPRATDPEGKLASLPDDEQQAIRRGILKAQEAGLVEIHTLSDPTWKGLSTYLTDCDRSPQVLHFDGHGLFGKRCTNPQCQHMHMGIKVERCQQCDWQLPDAQGFLVFEDQQGRADYISATDFADVLRRDIALVVLSACQSGMAVSGDSMFSGTAQQLVSTWIPSVVAMQYAVSVQSATEFCEKFYQVVGQQRSLLEAVSEGRKAMKISGNQWYRPVLYLRWQDNEGGQLFADEQGDKEDSETRSNQTEAKPTPVKPMSVKKLSLAETLELEDLKQTLMMLQEQYQACVDHARLMIDPASKVTLGKQAQKLLEKISKTENRIQELQPDSDQ